MSTSLDIKDPRGGVVYGSIAAIPPSQPQCTTEEAVRGQRPKEYDPASGQWLTPIVVPSRNGQLEECSDAVSDTTVRTRRRVFGGLAMVAGCAAVLAYAGDSNHDGDNHAVSSHTLSSSDASTLSSVASTDGTARTHITELANVGIDDANLVVLEDGNDQLSFALANEYTDRGDAEINGYPWRIAEPHRSTRLSAVLGSTLGDGVTFVQYTIADDDGATLHQESQDSTFESTYVFTELGPYTVTVLATVNKDDSTTPTTTYTYTERVFCKYVRREIRSLTDDDREAYFDAVAELAVHSDEEGKELYGDNFNSKDTILLEHIIGGADIDCDHWHAGTGFMTSHVAYTAWWEQAIQAVNPLVSAAYWDFTMDSEALGTDWRDSEVFASDWFGSAVGTGENYAVEEGRWAFTPVMQDAGNITNSAGIQGHANSYGLMRGPWNNNPTAHLSRSDNLYGIDDRAAPKDCSDYEGCLEEDNWSALARCFNGDGHGQIHQLMGGAWGGGFETLLLESDMTVGTPWYDEPLETFLLEVQDMLKLFWRAGLSTCPEYCAVDTPQSECTCTCDAAALLDEYGNSYEVLAEQSIPMKLWTNGDGTWLMDDTHVNFDHNLTYTYQFNFADFNDYADQFDTNLEVQDAAWDQIVEATCSGGFIGDMYEASSPNDITFWVLHTTMDRLWHYIRLSPQYDARFDDTWIDGDYGTCEGHMLADAPSQMFKNLWDSNDTVYTNEDIYYGTFPQNEELPWVYDNFEWEHCNELGYPMSNDFPVVTTTKKQVVA
jgi:hypothetical protein